MAVTTSWKLKESLSVPQTNDSVFLRVLFNLFFFRPKCDISEPRLITFSPKGGCVDEITGEDLFVLGCCLTARPAAAPLSFKEATDILTHFLSIPPFHLPPGARLLRLHPPRTTSALPHTPLRFLFSSRCKLVDFSRQPLPTCTRASRHRADAQINAQLAFVRGAAPAAGLACECVTL